VRARREQITDEELAVGERPMGDDLRHRIGLLLGEPQQITGHGQAQLDFRARYVIDPAPVQHRAQAALVAEALAQLPRTRERAAGLGRREAAGGDLRAAEVGLEAQLGLVAMAALGEAGQDVERALQVRNRFMGSRAGDRQLPRLAPEFDRLLVQTGFGAVLRNELRPVLQNLGEVRGERARDPSVQLGAALAQHGVVRGLLDQDVLEGVHRIRRLATPEHQLRGAELAQSALQLGLGQPGDRRKQLVGELAPDHRSDLRHLLDRAEAIQSGGQGIVQGIGDGKLGERPRQRIMIAPIGHQTALQDRPGQFLDEQRDAVGLSDDPLDQLGRQRLAAGQARDQFRGLAPAQPAEGQRGHVGLAEADRQGLGTPRDQYQHRDIGRAVDHALEQLPGRRIDPVHVLEHDQERSACGQRPQPLHERIQRLGFAPLGRKRDRPAALLARDRQQRSQ
jgi:hypothetical protein